LQFQSQWAVLVAVPGVALLLRWAKQLLCSPLPDLRPLALQLWAQLLPLLSHPVLGVRVWQGRPARLLPPMR